MFPLIFLWSLRLTVAFPSRIVFIRAPSDIGFFPVSAKQSVHDYIYESVLDIRNEEMISTAASNNDEQQLITEHVDLPQNYQLPLYHEKLSTTLPDYSTMTSSHSSKRTDLRLSGPIPNSLLKKLVDTRSLDGVLTVEDFWDENNSGKDSKLANYRTPSEVPLEQNENHPSLTGVIYGTQTENVPLPPSSFGHPDLYTIPGHIDMQNNLLISDSQPNQHIDIENDLDFQPEYNFENFSDEINYDEVSNLVTQPSDSEIPLTNYQSLQSGSEPTHFDFVYERDSIAPSLPLNYLRQNIPSPSDEQSNLPLQDHLKDFDKPIVQTCSGWQVLSSENVCVEPEVIRSIHSFSEPKDHRFPSEFVRKPFIHKPKVKLNLVVIKANGDISGGEPFIVPPPQEKTVVLVLKKDGVKQRKVIEIPAPAGGSPDVFFVNYKDGDNPILPGGIDLQTALSSSAKLGERIQSSLLVHAVKGYDSHIRSNSASPQLPDYDKMFPDETDFEGEFGDKIVLPKF